MARAAHAGEVVAVAADRVQGGTFTAMVLRISDPYDPALSTELAEQVKLSPRFFANAPVVVDLKDCLGCTAADDFLELKKLLHKHNLVPIGVQNASPVQQRLAQSAELASFGAGGRTPLRGVGNGAAANGSAAPADATGSSRGQAKTKLVTQPVRSGTQIYARGGDLVVAAPVSAGAEVIADGHIHVYGPLRGRASAGATGDATARIFVHRLEAELLCVAGRYLVSEAIALEHFRQAVQVALVNQQLQILPGWS